MIKQEDPLQSGLRDEAFELFATYARSNPNWHGRLENFLEIILANNLTSLAQIAQFEQRDSLAIKEYETCDDFPQQAKQFREMTFGEMYVLLTRLTDIAEMPTPALLTTLVE